MPLKLNTPIPPTGVEIVAKEISEFSVNLASMTAQIRFTHIDANGNRHYPELDQVCNVPLVTRDEEGNITGSRFEMGEYDTIKNVLYRLLTQDGFIDGEVE